MQQRRKVYVAVNLDVGVQGQIRPRAIIWKNGHAYPVSRVGQVCRAVSDRVVGWGTRYTVTVCGKEVFLFDEDGKWFVEAKAGWTPRGEE